MTRSGKMIGIVSTGALFALCAWVYLRTGDWVALVFAAGSVGWGLFFASRDVSQ